MTFKNAELGKQRAVLKTLPNAYKDLTINSTSGTSDFKSLDTNVTAVGGWIVLKAVDADITLLRGTHTLTVGNGIVLEQGFEMEFYIDPNGVSVLSHIAAADSKTLRVFYDNEQVG